MWILEPVDAKTTSPTKTNDHDDEEETASVVLTGAAAALPTESAAAVPNESATGPAGPDQQKRQFSSRKRKISAEDVLEQQYKALVLKLENLELGRRKLALNVYLLEKRPGPVYLQKVMRMHHSSLHCSQSQWLILPITERGMVPAHFVCLKFVHVKFCL